ncbi:vWA domain-containing protein [Paenibacillus methanolicus]|uniref:von Willebrand factor type A domain-containing protein n=1 Tax=Paenibacillus methanolicus TaxID=582686 RepID=A0A5S5BTW7_9BACL|nr:VWA domain-containing protein [Paenibacillus methanolicus]TYP69746.1 von Willebrand factor type A domain-containing protein [Paenibacillus methanolicus]
MKKTRTGMKEEAGNRKLTKGMRPLALLLAAALLASGCSSNDSGNDAATGNSAVSDAETDSSKAADKGSDSSAPSDGGDKAISEPSSESSKAEDRASPTKKPSGQQPDPQAGLLTAGEWNDLSEWQDWQQLNARPEVQQLRDYWAFYRFDMLDVRVTGGGRPVVDAIVRVVDEDGQYVWEARTDASGRAFAYAGLLDEQSGQGKYSVEVEAGGGLKQFENVPIPRGEALQVELDEAKRTPENLDLMFVVDTTGSMDDELAYLQTELKDVVNRVGQDNGQQLDIRVSTNFYRDKGDDYVVRPFPFTSDISTAVKQIGEQEAYGGGNFPEAVDQALQDAVREHEWSEDARARLLFLVLDAPPHHDDPVIRKIKRLTQDAAAQGIRIIPVVSSGADKNTEYLMRFMSVATGGTYLFLTDHSGVGNEHLDPTVGEYEVQPLNDLLVDVINRYVQAN